MANDITANLTNYDLEFVNRTVENMYRESKFKFTRDYIRFLVYRKISNNILHGEKETKDIDKINVNIEDAEYLSMPKFEASYLRKQTR